MEVEPQTLANHFQLDDASAESVGELIEILCIVRGLDDGRQFKFTCTAREDFQMVLADNITNLRSMPDEVDHENHQHGNGVSGPQIIEGFQSSKAVPIENRAALLAHYDEHGVTESLQRLIFDTYADATLPGVDGEKRGRLYELILSKCHKIERILRSLESPVLGDLHRSKA